MVTDLGSFDELEAAWWYNTKTNVVEHGMKSPSVDRLGPFATEAEAANAWEIVRERARRWAAEDARDD